MRRAGTGLRVRGASGAQVEAYEVIAGKEGVDIFPIRDRSGGGNAGLFVGHGSPCAPELAFPEGRAVVGGKTEDVEPVLKVATGCSEEDFVARLGGDEFVVMVYPAESTDELQGLAKRVLGALADPVMINGESVNLSSSIGISMQSGEDIDIQKLLNEADKAMYQAKSKGGNTFSL